MIYALAPTWILRGVTLLAMVAAWATMFRSSPTAAHEFLHHARAAIGLVNFVVFLLTFRRVFLMLYRFAWASRWWFPLLEGEWTGELRSNWPRIEAMMLAARGAGPSFNILSDELPDAQQTVTLLHATVRCALFYVQIDIDVPGTERRSHTIFARPQWNKPSAPQLAYMYEQTDHGPIAITDARQHRGAAILDYVQATGELRGEYWTNRQGARGLNTAGTLILKRR